MAEEIVPTLASPPGTDLKRYCATLLARFRNPALPHKTSQVAMDGSQKLPQRILATVRDRPRAARRSVTDACRRRLMLGERLRRARRRSRWPIRR
jgi:fructuronate reductase